MLMELTPSVEVTGGPWFTDQELDVDFVEQLTNACYKFVLMKVKGYLSQTTHNEIVSIEKILT